jgi:hypothetical protein
MHLVFSRSFAAVETSTRLQIWVLTKCGKINFLTMNHRRYAAEFLNGDGITSAIFLVNFCMCGNTATLRHNNSPQNEFCQMRLANTIPRFLKRKGLFTEKIGGALLRKRVLR